MHFKECPCRDHAVLSCTHSSVHIHPYLLTSRDFAVNLSSLLPELRSLFPGKVTTLFHAEQLPFRRFPKEASTVACLAMYSLLSFLDIHSLFLTLDITVNTTHSFYFQIVFHITSPFIQPVNQTVSRIYRTSTCLHNRPCTILQLTQLRIESSS